MILYTILCLSIYFLHYSSSCRFSADVGQMVCTSLEEVSSEGSESWNKLHVDNFNKNNVLHLKKNTFKRTPNLGDLLLTNISSIEEGSFNGLNKLNNLSIYTSELEEIPLGILDNLPIRIFHVYVSKVKSIAPGTFRNSPDIASVVLYNSNITQIEKNVFDNTQISELYLGNNQIENIANKAFENMTDLSTLSLHGNLLNSFSSEVYLGTSTSLDYLLLSKNKLNKITKDMFTTIPNLIQLSLELNQIETIEPESFHLIPFLKFLDISNNKLRQIQPNIFLPSSMKRLTNIYMQNNRLTFIDKLVFQRTPALKFITYGGNPFQCPCSEELDNLMEEINVTKVCDKYYNIGERPSCIISSYSPRVCIYDEDNTRELYKQFHDELENYPRLELSCDDFAKGEENAFLNNIENIKYMK